MCCFGGKKPSDEAHWQLVPLSPIVKVQWDVDAPRAHSPHHYRGQCLAEQECAAATLENRQRGERRRVPRHSLVLRRASWRLWLSALSPRGYYNPQMLGADRHIRQRDLSRAAVWDAVDNATDVVEQIERKQTSSMYPEVQPPQFVLLKAEHRWEAQSNSAYECSRLFFRR